MDNIVQLLQNVEVFEGLSDDELKQIAAICKMVHYPKGQTLTSQGDQGEEMFIVQNGLVEVVVGDSGAAPRSVINLGTGQMVGEMALVDRGPRSATARCATEASVYVLEREAFEQLCQEQHHIGMVVYRNLAADLSFKLRHSNVTRR